MYNWRRETDERVTRVEGELRSISTSLNSVSNAIEELDRKFDNRSDARDRATRSDHRFLISTIIALMATGGWVVNTMSDQRIAEKIAPVNARLESTSLSLSTLSERISGSQAMAKKSVDDTWFSQAVMYRELTGKDWPQPKETFPTQ